MDLTAKHEAIVIAARAHCAADMLVKGTYGRGRGKSFEGCSVGPPEP